jgi:hypothetical protein
MHKFIKNSKAFIFLLVFSSCGESRAEENKPTLSISNIPVTKINQAESPTTKNNKIVYHNESTKNEICDPDNMLCIVTFTSEGTTEAIIINKTFASRTVDIDIWSRNMTVENYVPNLKNLFLNGGEKKDLLKLTVIDPTLSYGHSFNFNSKSGMVDAVHDDNFIYTLPFEIGKNFKLMQGYGGSFSHNDQENYYSYDFKMPPGETVTASRGGIVVEVEESFKLGGSKRDLYKKANYVLIQHDDGTVGVYSHLSYNGAIVKAGDKVQQGQNIGISGATGYINGSHLHFSVGKYLKNQRMQSLPIKIKTQKGIQTNLETFVDYYK